MENDFTELHVGNGNVYYQKKDVDKFLEAQQQEIEQLKEENADLKKANGNLAHTNSLIEDTSVRLRNQKIKQSDYISDITNTYTKKCIENTKLKEDLAIHKGISDGKTIIIKQLEEEIRILKQYQEIARNDKHQRKARLNEALEEIKELKK